MSQIHLEIDRSEHPLDVVERLASLRHWIFDRAEADEMSISVAGRWADYDVAFTWIEDVEAMHMACAFDLKVPERRRAELIRPTDNAKPCCGSRSKPASDISKRSSS